MQRNAIIAGAAAGLVAGAVAVYLIGQDERKPVQAPEAASSASSDAAGGAWASGVTKDLAKGSLTAFVVKKERPPAADLAFVNETNEIVNLGQWRGKVVLLNLWATWCGPCRKEMPDLAELQKQLGGPDFEVVAISLDRKGAEAAVPFLIENKATALTLYLDPTAETLDRIAAPGLPATVLIDRQGREIGRLLGPADWASTEAITLIKAALAEKPGV